MNLSEIDFAQRYRDHMRRAKRPERAPEHWDARAPGMSRLGFDSRYVRQFLARMDLAGCATLLDVGCGPGTIGLSAAPRLAHVYGLDYSPGMLAAFTDNARARGLTQVTTILRSWEEDWSDVPVCDVVVASRSTAVPDLEAALVKLGSKARTRVYMSYPADGHFVPGDVRQAIGRDGGAMPDYLCVVGILHNLGCYPTLDYLPGENRLATCRTFDDVHAKVVQWVGPLSEEESTRLRRYYETNRDHVGQEPLRWALFSWDTQK
jgi:SAM-dependent methyltransferase